MSVLGAILVGVVIFSIIMIIFVIAQIYAAKPIPPLPICSAAIPCPNGLVCQLGQCKSPIGGTCTTLGDCVSSATICQGGICIGQTGNGVGQPCPCQKGLVCMNGFCRAYNGASCSVNTDCMSGFCVDGICAASGSTGSTGSTCIYIPSSCTPCLTSSECSSGYMCVPQAVYRGYGNGKMLPVINKKYMPGEDAIDVVCHDGYIYVLLEGGDILRVTDQMPTRLDSDIAIEQIVSFGGCLYGTCEGSLYRGYEDTLRFKWKQIEDIGNLVNMNCTYDGRHLWLETSSQGHLYDTNWDLVDRVKNKNFIKRVYGSSKKYYLDYHHDSVVASTGDVYPPGNATYHPNGYVFHPRNDEIWKVKVLKYRNEQNLYFILKRACLHSDSS